ncbi:protodermal factor 1-like isoform X1 [Tripterygium wilfordii]|uniref:protodermal factor 1-like isoform X1 n=1 Tax=Tripterygium wilfordii TaxID=458696 RepID=UPI0018F7F8DD|nr:protodermal factor 1-like isoform X1 [Tripterygium wilfordii]
MRNKQEGSVLIWFLVVGLLAQNLAVPVMSRSFENQKNYYSPPDPHSGTPPSGSHGSSPHGTTPSHGSGSHGSGSHGSGCSSGGTPPSHGGCDPTPTPASPPPSSSNCGTPPSVPTPSRPSHNPPPSGGGGSYYPPPTSSGGSPPTPVIVSPPTTPSIVPSPPFIPDPNTPFGGTCNYWSTHPTVVWGLLGWWCTLGSAFGVPSVPVVGPSMNVLQALSNTRADGLGALYREGTASLLNSMVNSRFPFTTKQVRDNFITALGSNKAAAAQARVFKLANEGHLKPRT